jgi:WhiB family redox-sensing transcriptional regulator
MRGTDKQRTVHRLHGAPTGADTVSETSGPDLAMPCADADPDLWFAERPAQLALAKALCAHCPIKAACLAGALDRQEPWGVWGGEIVQQGVVLAYKRGRGRPSNADRRLGLVTRVADRAESTAGRATGARARHTDGTAGPAALRSSADQPVTTPGRAGTCRSRSA